jgi:hypothetical protein
MQTPREKSVFMGKSKVSRKFTFKMNADANDEECAFCNKGFDDDKKEEGWGVFECRTASGMHASDNFFVCSHCNSHDAAVAFIKDNIDEEIMLQDATGSHGRVYIVDDYEDVTYMPAC